MTTHARQIAVLTGDLIESTVWAPDRTEVAMRKLADVSNAISHWGNNDPTQFTRFRGDGWQIAVTDHRYGLRAALCLIACLRAQPDCPNTRISIGLGGTNPLPADALSTASGPAFEASGRGLDAMSKSDRLSLIGSGAQALHQAVITLVEDISRHWSAEQAEAVLHYLPPTNPTMKGIAEGLGISSPAVHARLKGASGQALKRAVTYWEQHEEPSR